jgi:hypothetical protein
MTHLEQLIRKHLPQSLFEDIGVLHLEQYHDDFRPSGQAKAKLALEIVTGKGVDLSKCAYLSIGGSTGSEIIWMLDNSDLRLGVLLEFDTSVVPEVMAAVTRLSQKGKQLKFVPGDATQKADDCRRTIEQWHKNGEINCVVCSAQAVFHELPKRSPNYHLGSFLHKILHGWERTILICREPCKPDQWPSRVELAVRDLTPVVLEELANEIKRHLNINGAIRLVGEFVEMPAGLAVETLFKAFYHPYLRHELEERVTSIDPATFTQEVEKQLGVSSVSLTRTNSVGFEKLYRAFGVRARRPKSGGLLPLPVTFCQVIADSKVAEDSRTVPAAKGLSNQRTSSDFFRPTEATAVDGTQYGRDTMTMQRFLRRRCRVMPNGSDEFKKVVYALLSQKYDRNEAHTLFHKTLEKLDDPYESVMARAAYLENMGHVEEMIDALAQVKLQGTQESTRILYQAIAFEKLDDLAHATRLLRQVLESESDYMTLRAAQFNLNVCFEKKGEFQKVRFEAFRHDNDIVFVDNERLSDKAIAMYLICCIRSEKAFIYHEQLEDSLVYLMSNSTTGYIKTLLMKSAYEHSQLTPQVIGDILAQVPIMDSASRISILVTLAKYLSPDTNQQVHAHIHALIRSESASRLKALHKWKLEGPPGGALA